MGDAMRTTVWDVTGCARCGGDHPGLEHRPFTRPNPVYVRWATCPATGEPLLVRYAMPTPDGRLAQMSIADQIARDPESDQFAYADKERVDPPSLAWADQQDTAGMDGAAPGAGRCGAEPGDTDRE